MTKLDFKSKWSALKDYYPVPTAVKAVFQATYKAHTHAWATAWASNSSHHWHECTGDGCDITDNAKKNGYGEHVYTDAQDETCNTCNYKRTIVQDDGTPSVYSGTPDTSWYKEENSEFVLTTADQLYGFAKLVNEGKDFAGKTVKLGKNMVINEGDAATFGTTAPSHKWTPIAVAGTARFRGTFDGQGKYISGIYSVQGFLYPVTAGHVRIDADYERYRYDLQGAGEGRIRLFSFLYCGLRIILSRDVRRLIRRLRRGPASRPANGNGNGHKAGQAKSGGSHAAA
jgi:hypothetical protein